MSSENLSDFEMSKKSFQTSLSQIDSLCLNCSKVSSNSSSPNVCIQKLDLIKLDDNQKLCENCELNGSDDMENESKLRQKASSLTLETENTIINYSNESRINYYPETKRSLSVSVPRKNNLGKKKQEIQNKKVNLVGLEEDHQAKFSDNKLIRNSKPQTTQLLLNNDLSNGKLKTPIRTPSIQISENPLCASLCTCKNTIKNEFIYNNSASAEVRTRNYSINSTCCHPHQCLTNENLAHHRNSLFSQHTIKTTNGNSSAIFVNPNVLNRSKSSSKDSFCTQKNEPNQQLNYSSNINEKYNSSNNLKCNSINFLNETLLQNLNTPVKKLSMKNSNQISNHFSSNATNNKPYARDRLFSVGPTFHVQFAKPNSLNFNNRTSLEKKLIILICFLLLSIPFYSIAKYIYATKFDKTSKVCMTPLCVITASSLLTSVDFSVDPCEDFYKYACGTWIKKHSIPEDNPIVSKFDLLTESVQVVLKELLSEPISSATDNAATIKAKQLYKSCVNLDKLDKIGDEPLRNLINLLGGWPVTNENWIPIDWKIENFVGRLKIELNQGIFIDTFVGADDRNSTANIIQIDEMTFGLPSKVYYSDPSAKDIVDAYLKLMTELAVLLGAKQEYAAKEMRDVLDLEIKLANVSMEQDERKDAENYRKLTIKELQSIIKEFDWISYFNIILPNIFTPISSNEPIVVLSLSYIIEAGKILSRTDSKIIQNYGIWRVVRYLSSFLKGQYETKKLEFERVLLGISAARSRWDECVEMTNKHLGLAVGSLFIKDNFNENSMKTALEMIRNIREAFNELLDENEWMDPKTKIVAKKKANEMNERIGYPSFLTNGMELSNEYKHLEIYEDYFLANVISLHKFEIKKNVKKLRDTVDKNRWITDPAVVNAFYSPNRNDIVFPAGILQQHFYTSHFPKSLNYGGIGVVIGHEITHGFDDKGRQYDYDGNMKQWWENSTIKEFKKREQCIIDQYNSYVLEDINLNINGKLTKGENIADNGGLKQSYRAFKKFEKINGVEDLLPGLNLTHDQLFFLNYAQIWCSKFKRQDAANRIRTSLHPPGPIRVLGPLSNSLDFARTFNCPENSRMNPKKKCSVW